MIFLYLHQKTSKVVKDQMQEIENESILDTLF